MNGLLTAATFLTRLPLDRRPADDSDRDGGGSVDMARAVPWFPVVGMLVGGAEAAVYWFGHSFLTPTVGAALAVAVASLITGAFHHDGLADMADAFGGGWTVEQRLEILKDSRLGTYGVTVLALIVYVEVATVSALEPLAALVGLTVGHTLSRSAAIAMMKLSRPARGDGLGADYLEQLTASQAGIGVAVGVCLSVALLAWWAVAVVLVAALTTVAVDRLARAKIGGFTGDVLGAVQQLAHGAILCACVAASQTNAPLPWWV